MSGLANKKVGIAATRKAEEISTLVKKNGGQPSLFSIQGEQVFDDLTCEQNIAALLTESFDYIILTTGIGASSLERIAKEKGYETEFIQKVAATTLAIRGSKTFNWLKQHSLSPDFISSDGTMKDLLATLKKQPNKTGQRVFLQAYNQDDALLKDALQHMGYEVYLAKPYFYRAPNRETLASLQNHIIHQSLDAVIFTSKTQVQNLFNAADERLGQAFNEDVLAVAVGKVTAQELMDRQIAEVFLPTKPKMGRMVVELKQYYQQLVG
ncbi:uroporphyrinogen-III synthase [Virgibacillus salexigens]|uniref:uroporphyrinogen-III synthase n=1 Tax=Virgibacillus salexigens TaxID=61016 RepID=UPI0030813E9C